MGVRNGPTDPDILADLQSSEQPIVGVSTRIYTTDRYTYIELWQQGPDLAVGGSLVSFKRYRRNLQGAPDVYVLAGWLAREVGNLDRGGWPGLR